ncbi:hypothetical protein ES708_35047 [subsurface metagenome]
MIEISLEEFEVFYKEKLDSQFYKVKKAVKKQISDVRDNLIEIKVLQIILLMLEKEI